MHVATMVAVLCAMLLSSGVTRAQAVGETIDVQGWKLHLARNDDGSHTCAAMWRFDDDSAVGFVADTNSSTFLVVSEPEAELVEQQRYQVEYRVDDGAPKTAMGVATSKVMLLVPIPDPDTDFGAFRSGKTLTVEFGGDTYDEPLAGSKVAIQALARCIAGAPAK